MKSPVLAFQFDPALYGSYFVVVGIGALIGFAVFYFLDLRKRNITMKNVMDSYLSINFDLVKNGMDPFWTLDSFLNKLITHGVSWSCFIRALEKAHQEIRFRTLFEANEYIEQRVSESGNSILTDLLHCHKNNLSHLDAKFERFETLLVWLSGSTEILEQSYFNFELEGKKLTAQMYFEFKTQKLAERARYNLQQIYTSDSAIKSNGLMTDVLHDVKRIGFENSGIDQEMLEEGISTNSRLILESVTPKELEEVIIREPIQSEEN